MTAIEAHDERVLELEKNLRKAKTSYHQREAKRARRIMVLETALQHISEMHAIGMIARQALDDTIDVVQVALKIKNEEGK
jgi:predicted aconitase